MSRCFVSFFYLFCISPPPDRAATAPSTACRWHSTGDALLNVRMKLLQACALVREGFDCPHNIFSLASFSSGSPLPRLLHSLCSIKGCHSVHIRLSSSSAARLQGRRQGQFSLWYQRLRWLRLSCSRISSLFFCFLRTVLSLSLLSPTHLMGFQYVMKRDRDVLEGVSKPPPTDSQDLQLLRQYLCTASSYWTSTQP